MLSILNVFYFLLYGIWASIISFFFFYSLGLVVLPKNVLVATKLPVYPVFLGAALLALTCWYGLAWHISLHTVFQWILLFLIILATIRFKQFTFFKEFFNKKLLKNISFWSVIYIIFYILSYIFFPQPNTEDYLPIPAIPNIDLYSYMDSTQYLTFAGNPHVPHIDYISPLAFAVGSYYFHSWFSMFFNNAAMMAAMPLIYSLSAIIGVMITYYCHYFFRCSRVIAFCIAAIILSGSFYQYIVGNYFLASLMADIVLLSFLIEALKLNYSLKWNNFYLMIILILPYEMLLLLVYPVLFFVDLIVIWGAVELMFFYQCWHSSFKEFFKKSLFFSVGLLLSIAILALLNFSRLQYAVEVLSYSHITVGWGLSLLSPFSLFGIPSHIELVPAWQLSAMVLFGMFLLVLFCFNFKKFQPPAFSLFSILLGSLFAYTVYFYLSTEQNYQVWKFASYYILPLSGVFWGTLVNTYPLSKLLRFSIGFEHFFILIMLCIVGLNYYAFPFPSDKIEKKYANLMILNHVNSSDVWIKATGKVEFLARYYTPNKKIHFLNKFFYGDAESLTKISDSQAFFMETVSNCNFSKFSSGLKIDGVGCLYSEVPLLYPEMIYHVTDEPIFLELSNFSEIESDGRWTTSPSASITFYTYQREILKNSVGYINFEVEPFLYSGLNAQHLDINLKNSQPILVDITSKKWLSIPYTKDDWEDIPSSSLKKLVLHFNLPNATAPSHVDPSSSDSRFLGIKLIKFSLT